MKVNVGLSAISFPTTMTRGTNDVTPRRAVSQGRLTTELLITVVGICNRCSSKGFLPRCQTRSVILGQPIMLGVNGSRTINGTISVSSRNNLMLRFTSNAGGSFVDNRIAGISLPKVASW